jgi:hypothetical protein
VDVRVPDRLSSVLTAIHTDIKTGHRGILAFDNFLPRTKELVDGILLRLMKVEVIRDAPFRNNEGVPWRDWVSVIDRNRKLMIR